MAGEGNRARERDTELVPVSEVHRLDEVVDQTFSNEDRGAEPPVEAHPDRLPVPPGATLTLEGGS